MLTHSMEAKRWKMEELLNVKLVVCEDTTALLCCGQIFVSRIATPF